MKHKDTQLGTLLLLLLLGVAISLAIRSAPFVHIEDIDVSADGKTLAVSLWSHTTHPSAFMDIANLRYWVRLYQLDTRNYRDVRIHDVAESVVFSPDGSLLATGHQDGTIELWDVATGRAEKTLTAHNDTIWSLDFSPDGNHLASAGLDSSAKVWAVPSGDWVTTIEHEDWVTSVSISPDGRHIATGSRDGNIRIWNFPDGELTAMWVGHVGAVRPGAPNPPKGVIDLTYSHDGTLIASGGWDNTLAIWNSSKGELESRLAEDPRSWSNDVTVVAFSPDDRYVAAGYGENRGEHLAGTVASGSVFIYRSSDGERLKTLREQKVRNEGLVFTRDGKTLIAGGGGLPSAASIAMWEVESGTLQKQFRPGPTGSSVIVYVFAAGIVGWLVLWIRAIGRGEIRRPLGTVLKVLALLVAVVVAVGLAYNIVVFSWLS